MKRKILDKSWLIIVLIEIFPFVESILFSIPSSDDFSMAMKSWGFVESIKAATNMYFSWSGGGPFIFMEFLFNPLQYTSSLGYGYSIFLVITFLLFVVSIYVLTRVMVRMMIDGSNKIIDRTVFCVALFVILNTGLYPEIYYWFIGNSYLWAAVFAIFTVVTAALFLQNPDNKKMCILASFIGFIACFSSINAVAMGLIYLITLYSYYDSSAGKSKKVLQFVPLIFMIIGGVLSVAAPGNYARHAGMYGSDMLFIRAFTLAFNNTVTKFYDMMNNGVFIIGLLVLVLIGLFLSKSRARLKFNPFFIWLLGFIAAFGVLYPVALGYSNSGIPNRILFCVNIVIILWSVFAALYTGAWLKDKYAVVINNKDFAQRLTLAVGVVSAVIMFAPSADKEILLKRLPSAMIPANIVNIYKASLFYKELYREIANSSSPDVVIERASSSIPARTDVIRDEIGLSSDSKFWVNNAVARWYGKDSVVYKIIQDKNEAISGDKSGEN